MGELRLSGLTTGIDTTELVRQLMIVNSRRLATYQVKKVSYEDKSSTYDELRSKVRALDSAVAYLSDADDLEIYNATSSDRDILTISASSTANPSSHTVEINQLATSETWIQDTSTFSYETDYVGEGDFIYSYNHQERVITAVDGETTLEDFVGLINNDADNPGVTASLLYQGDKYHLMLSGQETGEDYQISVNLKNTEVWEPDEAQADHTFTKDGVNAALSTKITELTQFQGTLGSGDNAYITISGKNHFGTDILPDLDLDVTANTTVGHLIDAINEHFDGIATATFVSGQIRLTDHMSDTSGMEIDLSYDAGSGSTTLGLPTMAVSTVGGDTSESLTSLSSTSFIETQSAQSSKIKMDDYSPSMTGGELQTLTLDDNASGNFRLTYNGQTTGLIAANAFPVDIQTALEALSNVSPGDIIVDGTRLSQGGPLTFQFLESAGDVSMISIDASALSGPTSYSFTETTKGNDGWLSRNGNSINDALTGITLNLKDVTEASEPIEITVTRDTASVRGKIQKMVTAYNELITFLAEKTEYNDETKKMGILSADIATSLIKTQMREPFIGVAVGFTEDDTFFQSSDIGITFDSHGMMEFDTSEFNEAVAEDFMAVLELLGATKSGDTVEGATIEFYSASDKYTTAGTYDVRVTIDDLGEGNVVTDAEIKLSSESTYRTATWSGTLVTGDSTFDDDGRPLYPENSLQLSVVDLTSTGTFTGTVRVKQGMVGALEDFVDEILKTDGRIDISKDILNDSIEQMEKTIEREENRLDGIEARLIAKFARLEKTLSLIQQQFSAASIFSIVE
ncbi:MAG: flagellar filament capping protein FliD [Planctomycetota bacterium]|jgi:flagellar hook-associated protein 2